mmetsp:Transcript_4609/g.10928  ORF Transcript_4609/g.10928 Transcript_4609/m.10928 type:complete len:203 (+) Transcript_4609:153-761(+)
MCALPCWFVSIRCVGEGLLLFCCCCCCCCCCWEGWMERVGQWLDACRASCEKNERVPLEAREGKKEGKKKKQNGRFVRTLSGEKKKRRLPKPEPIRSDPIQSIRFDSIRLLHSFTHALARPLCSLFPVTAKHHNDEQRSCCMHPCCGGDQTKNETTGPCLRIRPLGRKATKRGSTCNSCEQRRGWREKRCIPFTKKAPEIFC